MPIILLIMNKQNKLYTIHFSPRPMTVSQPVPEQRSWNPQVSWSSLFLQILANIQGLYNLPNSWKKNKLPEKFELLSKRIQTHGNEKSREFLAPQPTPIPKISMTSMVWNISVGQPGCLSGCAPSQLLHTCLLAESEKLEKVLDFVATPENISVINTILLNPTVLLSLMGKYSQQSSISFACFSLSPFSQGSHFQSSFIRLTLSKFATLFSPFININLCFSIPQTNASLSSSCWNPLQPTVGDPASAGGVD